LLFWGCPMTIKGNPKLAAGGICLLIAAVVLLSAATVGVVKTWIGMSYALCKLCGIVFMGLGAGVIVKIVSTRAKNEGDTFFEKASGAVVASLAGSCLLYMGWIMLAAPLSSFIVHINEPRQSYGLSIRIGVAVTALWMLVIVLATWFFGDAPGAPRRDISGALSGVMIALGVLLLGIYLWSGIYFQLKY